ncbi:MAG TPA: cytochrome ubiquinol oxidase subunit I [Myxococcales bacterium]|jgi:cytochrome d ubiquinol oxidase subunit I
MDVVVLSRIQFALTIMFHYLFPPLTIGMGVVLVYLEGMYLRTREPIYESAARFWTSLFAATFAIGVATGIVMEFQFGTNWAAYSRFVGDVFGSALAAEGIFAFFLESGFLSVLVFGWDKVSAGFHFFATLMVALGSIFSSVWIVVANSWQQTPAGHHVVQMLRDGAPWSVDGAPVMRAEVVDFWAVVFNPSTVDRLTHTLIGAMIMGSFFILSVSAWYLLKGRHEEFARRSFSGALIFATVFSLAELFSGHSNARMVAREQPAKLAAMEGHFATGPADLHLFGFPDTEAKKVHLAPAIPGGLGLLAYDSFRARVIGLDAVPAALQPPVGPTFQAFHAMVMLGMFFIGVTLLASFLRLRGKLWNQRWLLWIFVFSVLGAVAANQLGWATAEVGRQPWTVTAPLVRDAAGVPVLDAQGLLQYRVAEGLLTKASISESVGAGEVATSIAMFSLIYLLLGAVWIVVLDDKIKKGPAPITLPPAHTEAGALLAATAGRTAHEQSLSEAKQPSPPTPSAKSGEGESSR